MEKFRVMLADDHILFREAVKQSLKEVDWLSVVGEAGDGRELMNLLRQLTPDLIILDISMPHIQGLEAASMIKSQFPGIKILILSMHKSGEYVRRALATGVEGYLIKENALSDLVNAVQTIRRGETYISSLLGGKILRGQMGLRMNGEPLTPREVEILKLVGAGKSSKEIAEALGISIMTVFNHRVHIKTKLDIKKNAELIKFAIENGYV